MIQKVDRASIKLQAKQQLQGKIWMTFLCLLISGVIGGAIGGIPSKVMEYTDSGLAWTLAWFVYLAGLLMVAAPIGVGLTKVYLNVTYGYKPSVATLFEPFSKNYKNSVLTPFLVGLFEFLWYIPFFIVSIILTAIVFAGAIAAMGTAFMDIFLYGDMPSGGSISGIIGSILGVYLIILLLMIPYVIIINAYAQSVFVLCEYPDMAPMDCIRASKAMMKGRRWELFVLNLSFILWYLLVVVTFGIAIIYVGPYVSVTLANYYHRIKGGYVGPDAYNNNGYPGGGYGQPMQNQQYGAPYGQGAQNAQYGAPVQNTQYGAPAQNQAPYGYGGQPQNPAYGDPSQTGFDPNTGAPVQPSFDPNTGAPVQQAADQVVNQAEQVVSESQQALDQASHDMMTNFDDYTVPTEDDDNK